MGLREDTTPVVQAARHVLLALREPLRDELKRMKGAGIIAKISDGTNWVGPLVIIKIKNGNKELAWIPGRNNSCINWEHYEIVSCQDIAPELSGAKV